MLQSLFWIGVPVLVAHAKDSEIVVGNVRVQALSQTLIRVEPKGPLGFEDNTTFTVVDRDFDGVPIKLKSDTDEGTLLSTEFYDILLKNSGTPAQACSQVSDSTDVGKPSRSANYPQGAKADNKEACCALCEDDTSCKAWVYKSSSEDLGDVPGANCWPLSGFAGTQSKPQREFGCSSRGCSQGPVFTVTSPSGEIIYDSDAQDMGQSNLLHWPAPLVQKAYSLMDYPRFFVPAWGAVPVPEGASIDPSLNETSGFDFRNNVAGDTYVFLLGSDLSAWQGSRKEFLKLGGPCPLLPDYAYGTWFTWWHGYKESEAKDDIDHWENLELPIDIWALDMNWRKTDNNQDRYYNYPNDRLFPNFTEWFEYLKEHKLRTYFNDHPYPVADRDDGAPGKLQTSPEEVEFRWEGLTEWMKKGLTFWWFDHNWRFSIPPPFVDTNRTSGNWEGLDNAAWGSHVYFNAVRHFDETVRDKAGDDWYGRPMTLTKFALPDWRPGKDHHDAAESPAQHRFPVWWTGDGVNLQGSVESMVDSGLYDFKPFVHSDCGGDYRGSAGDLLRWTAHCTYGSILRFHGNDHRSWTYDNHTVDVVRSYLNARYKLVPSLVAAGQRATETGHPIVARGDLYWPEQPESATNQQYIFLDDILVAPIWDSKVNETSRSVWIPPGEWEDAWNGSVVTGPANLTTTQPYERIPMWHRRDGGLLVLADRPATRVEDQDWSSLTLEAFPSSGAKSTRRSIFERKTAARTDVVMHTDGQGMLQFSIGAAEDENISRAWTLRVHLKPMQHMVSAAIDGIAVENFVHLDPCESCSFPLSGVGAPPAVNAGSVVEISLPHGSSARRVDVTLAGEEQFV